MIGRLLAPWLLRRRAGRPARLDARISIGMAAHGNAATTRAALEALFASASGDFELILVDDCSPDDVLAVYRDAAAWHANTRIYRFPENLEYGQSVNAFLSQAKGELLFFLSNDVFANPTYLRELLRAAAAHPDCGILRGCSNYVDNSSPLHNVAVPPFGEKRELFAFSAGLAAAQRASAPVDERFLVGDAFLVKRAVLERIGGFDTRFVGYCGDLDFGLRAQIAGFRVVLVRSAFAYHEKFANAAWLPPEAQRAKAEARLAKLAAASRAFLEKYPVHIVDGTVHDLPWEDLARQPFDAARHYVAPLDYGRYELPRA